MADNGEPKTEDQHKPLHNIDPAVVAKVDKMMSTGSHKADHEGSAVKNGVPTGAPLLPDDKLPDFNKSRQDRPPVKSPADKSTASKTDTAKPQQEKPDRTDKLRSIGDDPKTAKAVDEIAEEESDRMLAIEDAKAALLAEGTAEIDKGLINRIKTKLSAFWHNKKARNTSLAGILLLFIVASSIPGSRYFLLNSFGVRASMSIRVIDDKTDQPLKNVQVSIGSESAKTDIDGKIKLEKIKLGHNQLSVKKPAFADVTQDITIGWGSNPRGDVGLTAVGSSYIFEIKDFVSGQPVKTAEATSGEASATTNDKGEIVLVVADQNESSVNVQINAANYRPENITFDVGSTDSHQISLVPSRKHAFVSKRSGKYDLYRIDVDGKNEKEVIAGTGTESEDNTVILPSPNSDTVAYISTRGDRHNGDGFALSSLMIVNLDTDKADTIDHSERIQLVDFIGNKLIYVKIAEGESAASPNRNRLMSYDLNTKEQKELVSTNYFNDVLIAEGAIYYAPAAYNVNGSVGLFKINADGSSKTTVYGKEVWNLFRVAYGKIDAAVGQSWYEYDISTSVFNVLGNPPSEQKSRIYADSPDRQKSAWVDVRDGKGVLVIYDVATGQDKVIQTQSGLTNPISWLDGDHLVYRIANNDETADYVVSLSGGSPKKIKDVTNTAGLDRWYYY